MHALRALPVATATRFRTAVVVDHQNGTTSIVGEQDKQPCVEQMHADILALPHALGLHQA